MMLKKHDKNSIGLIGHVIVDYPDKKTARAAIDIMVDAGVSLIEAQIPFSEPIADGPLFTQANHQAIANGVHVDDCFEFMQDVSSKHDIPFVFMTYANILYHQGYDAFISRATKVGVAGAIVPDLPVDLAGDYLKACEQHDFAPIQIIPPNISSDRLPLIANASKGFIYVVARQGVTGTKTEFSDDLAELLSQIREVSDLPLAVGFGVQSREDVEFLKPYADYAIVGTQALRILQQQGLNGLQAFWKELCD